MNRFTRYTLAGAATVALLAGASSLTASAAPLAANAELKGAVSSNTIDVQRRWRGRRNVAIGLGVLGAGIIAGAAINSNRGYYGEPYGYYGYDEGPYAYGYYQQPRRYYYNDIDAHTGGAH